MRLGILAIFLLIYCIRSILILNGIMYLLNPLIVTSQIVILISLFDYQCMTLSEPIRTIYIFYETEEINIQN